MFCPLSGYLLELDPVRGVAHCPMTGYQKSLDGARPWLATPAHRPDCVSSHCIGKLQASKKRQSEREVVGTSRTSVKHHSLIRCCCCFDLAPRKQSSQASG
jgi:hypothetical protein